MKNRFLFLFFFLFYSSIVFAENIFIEAKNISIDKNKQLTLFENEVRVKTYDGYVINSDLAEYNKSKGILILKKNITGTDKDNNVIKAEFAKFNEKTKIFKTSGATNIITSENYIIESSDIILDNSKKQIFSEKQAIVTDQDRNKIFVENFDFQTKTNIFKSIGNIKVIDIKNNKYEFSQVYIDTKKKEILGTDIKSYLNDRNFKINEKNKPRVFANTLKMNEKNTEFNKSIFTLCDYRENDECPPWSIQATKMLHDSEKKTIYYDNAVVKVYNVPIFYLPKLSHPDPTVSRRSGFLVPTISDSKNLGFGASVPYFFAINKDKNFTLTSKFYANEHPLFIGEYHQAFKNSSFIADFGYTEGYNETSATKTEGSKSHFFSKFVKNFKGERDSENTISFSLQTVSNDKYLKLYKLKSNLVDYNQDTLESSLDFTHEDGDIFFGLNTSVFETLKDSYEDKYEYIIPEITFNKNLFASENLGNLDFQSNLKIHNYDTNKLTNFIVNDLNWSSKDFLHESGIKSKFLGSFKNINYESKNVDIYKNDPTSEVYGALGYQSEVKLKKDLGENQHFLTPKFFARYAPGSMRKENSGSRLNPSRAFSMDRLENVNNFESGMTGAFGLDYQFKNSNDQIFDFSIAQIINKEENKKMSSESSLDEKLSDFVGSANFNASDKIKLNYNFALDQNYKELNYNDMGTQMNFGALDINFNYLQEKNHIGNKDYIKTKLTYEQDEKGMFSFETKRNLITNSSEFYNLSYEYINDCLRAGLVYRREFYNDSELEAENSLFFKITLTPFGGIDTPSLN